MSVVPSKSHRSANHNALLLLFHSDEHSNFFFQFNNSNHDEPNHSLPLAIQERLHNKPTSHVDDDDKISLQRLLITIVIFLFHSISIFYSTVTKSLNFTNPLSPYFFLLIILVHQPFISTTLVGTFSVSSPFLLLLLLLLFMAHPPLLRFLVLPYPPL